MKFSEIFKIQALMATRSERTVGECIGIEARYGRTILDDNDLKPIVGLRLETCEQVSHLIGTVIDRNNN